MYPSDEQRYVQFISRNDRLPEIERRQELQLEIERVRQEVQVAQFERDYANLQPKIEQLAVLLAALDRRDIDPAQLRALLGSVDLATRLGVLNHSAAASRSEEEARLDLIHKHEHTHLPEEPEERTVPPKPGIVDIRPGSLPRSGERPRLAHSRVVAEQERSHALLWAFLLVCGFITLWIIFSR